MFHVIILLLVQMIVFSSAQILSVENADGSYSIGLWNSEGQGSTADAVLGLLSLAAGWTPTSLKYPDPNVVSIVPSLEYVLKSIRQPIEEGLKNLLLIKNNNKNVVIFVYRVVLLILDFLKYYIGSSDATVYKWLEKKHSN
ncbi:uncharacterized protein LOC130449953 [Diorhabda sublineata]|uniref:uncharacterized protein LOC130449953 n=1 Tax=Diorhabda sublineata TaxID=1163346 RepID=UPI0024E0CD54|nr:uncharacterized protein LOC130449953 [Diorhabda sublineata]